MPGPEVPTPKINAVAAAHIVRAKLSPAAVPAKRKRIALVLAGIADIIQVGGAAVFMQGAVSIPDDILDGAMVVLLTLILGFRWRLLLSLGLELVPFATLFPSWTAAVASLPVIPEEPETKVIDVTPKLGQ
jgi:hypothetical protein